MEISQRHENVLPPCAGIAHTIAAESRDTPHRRQTLKDDFADAPHREHFIPLFDPLKGSRGLVRRTNVHVDVVGTNGAKCSIYRKV